VGQETAYLREIVWIREEAKSLRAIGALTHGTMLSIESKPSDLRCLPVMLHLLSASIS
jgi:hypothetical protein